MSSVTGRVTTLEASVSKVAGRVTTLEASVSKVEKVVLVKDKVTAYRCGQVGHIVVGGDVNPAHTAARVQIATLPKGWWPASYVYVTGTAGAVLLTAYDGAVRVEGSAGQYYVACSYLIDVSKT